MKKTRSKLIKEFDAVFSKYIRLRDCNDKGIVVCPLCGSKIPWKKSQNMHFISRGNFKYRWDEENCHAGCMRCNVILNGNYIVYTRWMQSQYGMEKVDAMINDKGLAKIRTPQIEEQIAKYKYKIGVMMMKLKE